MSNRTKLGLNILGAALLLGVLGDALLRETPWGLNVFLWTGALVAAMCVLHGRFAGRASWRADGGWLLLPALFFAAAFAWRDSATLKMLDGLALFTAFALLAWRARGRKIRLGGVAEYALGLGHAAFDVMFASLPLVISDVQWASIPRNGVMRHAWAAARGLVIAVPLLLIFCALLMAADAVFDGIMRQTFALDADALFSHFFLALLFAWMTGGFLRGMMSAEETAAVVSEAAPVAYTSITVDDDKRHGAASPGTTPESESNAHRQPPESVVVEGGAVAAAAVDGNSGVEGKKPDGGGNPEGIAYSGVRVAREDGRGRASGATTDAAQAAADGAHATAGGAHATAGEARAAAGEAGAAATTRQGFSLGAVEVGVVLGLLNVLFACFVAVQFRYFFGGAARVMSITELTYSEYARRGFFELTWVAGLVLPLLLGMHALLRKDSLAAGRIFRPLAGAQVGLLFVIMASAVARMRLYQSEYGLTELRLYTTAFMFWLGLVFVWFAWTVLVRNARQRFACGALVAAFVTVGLLHLVNPDAYIVRANAAHARAGHPFDAEYAAWLSADAMPTLISVLPSLSRDERCRVEGALGQGWTSAAVYAEDWRAWNLARWRARRAVAKHMSASSETYCPPPASSVPVNASTSAPDAPPPPAPATNATSAAGTTPGNATPGNAMAATADASKLRVLAETKAGTPVASKAEQAMMRRNGKTKQHDRTRAAKRAKRVD
ncbi:MAG TPA: DUF4173 domain-containing protein [Pyrinomonadaceae bacterium]|nr:DUF4173 domain-containing protein [Pyrinomonadaceae bacterium]